MTSLEVFQKMPFQGLRAAKRWLEEVRQVVGCEEDLRRLLEVACFYEQPMAAFELLKKAYLNHNQRLSRSQSLSVSPYFVSSERELYEKRRQTGARRTLGLLAVALDEGSPTDPLKLVGRSDVVALQDASYQGSWSAV